MGHAIARLKETIAGCWVSGRMGGVDAGTDVEAVPVYGPWKAICLFKPNAEPRSHESHET